jgi:hypothetical protein
MKPGIFNPLRGKNVLPMSCFFFHLISTWKLSKPELEDVVPAFSAAGGFDFHGFIRKP